MNVRTRVMIIGGVVGSLIGVSAAYLYLRSVAADVDDEGRERLPSIQPRQALGVTLGVLTVLRQITSLGQPQEDKGRGHKGRR